MKLKNRMLTIAMMVPLLGMSQGGTPELNAGDTAWVLVATAMVILMTPAGLALFYGGLTRSKNVLNTIGMSYIAFCVATVAWIVIGYSFAFTGNGAFLGNFENAFLKGIGITELSGTIPHILFVAFQGAFAAIAVAIVSGSIIERMKFSTWIIFAALWVICIYSPIAHWIWGGGFLSNDGELDFAGGTVIHVNAGVAGLVVALLLGKRRNFHTESEKPSSIKLTVLGSALLWFGWFGFNGGSALAADFVAANAFMVTNVSACVGGITWTLIEWIESKKPTLIGAASGVVSGLVAITPAAGYVNVSGALAIGLLGGLFSYIGVVKLKKMFGYDDTPDAFGTHGFVGMVGAIVMSIFANPAINDGAGILYDNPSQLLVQLKAIGITLVFSVVGTTIIFKLSALLTGGARVQEEMEKEGLDKMLHGEKSFDLDREVLKKEHINH